MISRSTDHRVTNIEKTTAEVRGTFQNCDDVMQQRIKASVRMDTLGISPTPTVGQTLLRKIAIFAKNLNAYTTMIKSLRLMMRTTHLISLKIHT